MVLYTEYLKFIKSFKDLFIKKKRTKNQLKFNVLSNKYIYNSLK